MYEIATSLMSSDPLNKIYKEDRDIEKKIKNFLHKMFVVCVALLYNVLTRAYVKTYAPFDAGHNSFPKSVSSFRSEDRKFTRINPSHVTSRYYCSYKLRLGNIFAFYLKKDLMNNDRFTFTLTIGGVDTYKTSSYTMVTVDGDEYYKVDMFENDERDNDEDFFPMMALRNHEPVLYIQATFRDGSENVLYALVEHRKYMIDFKDGINHVHSFKNGRSLRARYVCGVLGIRFAEDTDWINSFPTHIDETVDECPSYEEVVGERLFAAIYANQVSARSH